jgi:hypothetical protein
MLTNFTAAVSFCILLTFSSEHRQSAENCFPDLLSQLFPEETNAMKSIHFSAFGACALLVLSVAVTEAKDPEAFSIEASHKGHFSSGWAWTIQIDTEGHARLTVFGDKTVKRDFQIPPKKFADFKAALDEEKFFDLPEVVGKAVPDASERKLEIKQGDKHQVLTIKFIHEKSLDGQERKVARRATRVWASLRGLFDDKDAFDIRQSEEDLRK